MSVISAVDGMIPSDMAAGRPEELEEERRLLYVALTRARRQLDVYVPLRFYHHRLGANDAHSYAPLSRFLAGPVRNTFDAVPSSAADLPGTGSPAPTTAASAVDQFLDALWR